MTHIRPVPTDLPTSKWNGEKLGFLYISSRFPVLVSKRYHAISNICIRILFDTTDIVWYWRPWYRMFDIDWYCVSKMALRSRLYPNRRLYQKHLIFDTGTLDIADTVDTVSWYDCCWYDMIHVWYITIRIWYYWYSISQWTWGAFVIRHGMWCDTSRYYMIRCMISPLE